LPSDAASLAWAVLASGVVKSTDDVGLLEQRLGIAASLSLSARYRRDRPDRGQDRASPARSIAPAMRQPLLAAISASSMRPCARRAARHTNADFRRHVSLPSSAARLAVAAGKSKPSGASPRRDAGGARR